MRKIVLVAACILLEQLVATGCGSSSTPTPVVALDAGVSGDGRVPDPPDASRGEGGVAVDPICIDTEAKWQALLARSRACAQVADCELLDDFDDTAGCGITRIQEAIARSARPEIEDFLEREKPCDDSSMEWPSKTYDAAPLENLRCVSGRCTADSPSCLDDPGS